MKEKFKQLTINILPFVAMLAFVFSIYTFGIKTYASIEKVKAMESNTMTRETRLEMRTDKVSSRLEEIDHSLGKVSGQLDMLIIMVKKLEN